MQTARRLVDSISLERLHTRAACICWEQGLQLRHTRTQTTYPNGGASMFFTYDSSSRLTRVLGKKPVSGLVLTDFLYSGTNGGGPGHGAASKRDGQEWEPHELHLRRAESADAR